MQTKAELLFALQAALNEGILTESDIKPFIATQPTVVAYSPPEFENKPEKLSAVDIMFYIAGIVLFSTMMSIIVQSWNDGSPIVHIFLSAVIGMGLWSIAFFLIKSPAQNDIRKGLTNALLLTGSLLIIAGGYIITNDIIGGFQQVNLLPAAFTLAILGGFHIGFDRLIKRDLILLLGVFLAVAAFPTLLSGLLQNSNPPMDVWATIVIISAGILIFATRVVAKMNPGRKNIRNAFDAFAAFLALISMYAASFGDYGVFWLITLIAAVFGIFYLSIILQNKNLLGNGSFFMVLTIITIAFKYFRGFGITFSLIVATFGLLASAAVAASINKKYFKKTLPEAAPNINSQLPYEN